MLRSPATPRVSVTVNWESLTGKPTSFPPSAHKHPIEDVTGLQAALDAKQASGSYVTTTNFTWANLSGKPPTFPPASHTHAWAEITGKPLVPVFIGNVTVAETIAIALVAGDRRKTLSLAGVTASDKLIYVSLAPCAAGCEALNVYPGAGQVIVAYSTPTLAVGAVVNIPIAVYRLV